MVENQLIHAVLKQLEKYIVRKNNFQLIGETYDLILFVPSDKYQSNNKFSLLISYRKLDHLNQKDVIKEILTDFKEDLRLEEYNSISRLNIVHSEDNLVKNLKFIFAFREQIFEIKDILIGGVQIDFAFLVKSLVIDKLIPNRALILEILTKENLKQTIDAGVLRIERNFDIIYYTGKGLKEIWKHDMTETETEKAEFLKKQSEEYLLENQYLSKINLDQVLKVY